MRYPKNLFLFSILMILVSCSDKDSTSYKEETATQDKTSNGFSIVDPSISNITFSNNLSDDPLTDKNIMSFEYYFNGAGVGVADFNQDGLQDIFFAGNEVPNEIYINKGDFNFEKLPATSGINVNKVWASGVSIIDINLDGYPDIYVSQQGPYEAAKRRNLFYINNKDLTFTESAKVMGLDDPNLSTQAAFLDFDKDGDLDCYILNESQYSRNFSKDIFDKLKDEKVTRNESGRFFLNNGDLSFTDITKEAGVLKYGFGLGVCISDINGDNWPDIYVTNDYRIPDFLYINQKNGTFKESIKEYTKQISYFAMGVDIADINNDKLVDIAVVDMAADDHFRDKTLMSGMDTDAFKYFFHKLGYQFQYMFNSLQLNNGNNSFSNVAAMSGVLKSDWSWAALLNDLNLDGHKDYYISNGYRRYARDNDTRNNLNKIKAKNGGSIPKHMRQEIYDAFPQMKMRNRLYLNNGHLGFNENDPLLKHPELSTYSSGVAYADLDNDGDQDLIINNIDQIATLLKNETREKTNHNYIKVTLDEINPAKKLGSKLIVKSGNKEILQEYYQVRGYESSMEEALVFGLGQSDKVDQIEIIWPDGNCQIMSNPKINTHHKVKYIKGKFYNSVTKTSTLLQPITAESINLKYEHKENVFDDFKTEILLPQKQSAFGPAIATGDINKDGLDDIFFGSSKGYKSALYLQTKDGQFSEVAGPWQLEPYTEDVAASFVDPNQDGNLDLIVLCGGSGDFVGEENKLINKFYANNKGQFFRIGNILPNDETASYDIIKQNVDDDPQYELLILGAAIPGKYPLCEKTVLLDYQGDKYVNIIDEIIPGLNKVNGLIRDAIWIDLDNDGTLELITVGEWQNIDIYSQNAVGVYHKASDKWGTSNKEGWWRSIAAADLDGDGDTDLVVGNVGKNFKQKASADHPLYLYSNDFDGNGTLDCVLAKDYNNKIVPARGKECSTEQMPFISDKFKTYNAFASASIDDILGKDKIKNGVTLKAVNFYSYILWNDNNKFIFEKLDPFAQTSPINDIEITDINGDGKLDITVVGNDYNTEYETPRLDAGTGRVLINKDNKYLPLSIRESGLYNPGDAKRIGKLKWKDQDLLIIVNNNSKPGLYALPK